MNRNPRFFIICYILLLSIGSCMANQISVRPLPLPIGEHQQQPVPLPHPVDDNPIRPLSPAKIKIHSEIGLLLIEDDVTAQKYVTTLDSRGNRMMGSSTQTIFGFPHPTAQMKPITWYTHGVNMDVQSITELVPAEAFVGVTDVHGAALEQVNSGIDIQPSGSVNPVFSPKAWDEFSKMPVGGSHAISVTEILVNGGERRLDTLVNKRAQLRFSQAEPDCKPEMVDGVEGQVCTLRTITGQHQATSAGDIRFTVKAQSAREASRFRIANKWHNLGEPITIAEFANGRTLDIFIPSRAGTEGTVTIRVAERFEAMFFSLSRQGNGDRFSIRMDRHNGAGPQPPVLARADLLLIEDLPTARQYVTTLGSSGSQMVFGELHHPQGVKWYTTLQQGMAGLNPLVRVSQLQPSNYFQGIANASGQVSPSIVRPAYEKGYIYPLFNDDAFNALNAASVGRQQRLSLMGEYDSGANAPFLFNINKKGHIKLEMPADNRCSAASVEGYQGVICPLREVSGEGDYVGSGDVRFNLNAKLPFSLQQNARYRVGNQWFRLGQHINLSEFNKQALSRIEVFIPDDKKGATSYIYAIEGSFFSQNRRAKDNFTLGFSTKRSPTVEKNQRVNAFFIEDNISGNEYVLSASSDDSIFLTGSKIANGRGHAAKLIFKNALPVSSMSVTPQDWVYQSERSASNLKEVTLTTEGFSGIKRGASNMIFDLVLPDGRQLKNNIIFNNLGIASFRTDSPPICESASVDDISGVICQIASVNGTLSSVSNAGKGEIQVVVPDGQQLRIASGAWHKNKDMIAYSELSSGFVEVFIPNTFSVTNLVQSMEYRLDFKSAFNNVFSIKLMKKTSIGNANDHCSGSTNYAPHFGRNESYYAAPASLDLSGLQIGQEQLIHHFIQPNDEYFAFNESRDGRTYACKNDPHRINETKPFPANSDGTIPSGNSDFVFALYKRKNNELINANGGILETSPGGFMTWYFKGGYELRVKRIANTGDQSKISYPQIIPDLVPRDTSGRVWVYEAPDGPAPLEQRGFWTDSEGVWPFPPVPAIVDYVKAEPNQLTAGETTVITVHLDRKALADQAVYVKFDGKGSADIGDLSKRDMQNLVGATNPVADLSSGGVVLVKEAQEYFTFEVPTVADMDTTIETFDIRAKAGSSDDPGAKFATVTINPLAEPAKVDSVIAVVPSIKPDSMDDTTVIQVHLNKKALANQKVYVKFDGKGSADITDLEIPGMMSLQGASHPVENLADGGYVLVNENVEMFSFPIVAASDTDISEETFEIRAKEGESDDPSAHFARVTILPKDSLANVLNVTASPENVDAGSKTHISIELDKEALGTELIYLKLFTLNSDYDDIATPFINSSSALTGATGNIADLFTGGYVTAKYNTRTIEFDMTMADDLDKFEESFLVNAKEQVMPEGTAKRALVTILPKLLSPEISFTNEEPPKSGMFNVDAPDVQFSYGVKLINYVPSRTLPTKDMLNVRLLRALSIKVDVSGIKSYNPGGKNYCAFETDDGKLVPFPFFLQQETGTEMPIDCTTFTSLPFSAPESWTGTHVDTTYNTTLNARVVMGDQISQMASGMGWQGTARLNGTLTLNMQVK